MAVADMGAAGTEAADMVVGTEAAASMAGADTMEAEATGVAADSAVVLGAAVWLAVPLPA